MQRTYKAKQDAQQNDVYLCKGKQVHRDQKTLDSEIALSYKKCGWRYCSRRWVTFECVYLEAREEEKWVKNFQKKEGELGVKEQKLINGMHICKGINIATNMVIITIAFCTQHSPKRYTK